MKKLIALLCLCGLSALADSSDGIIEYPANYYRIQGRLNGGGVAGTNFSVLGADAFYGSATNALNDARVAGDSANAAAIISTNAALAAFIVTVSNMAVVNTAALVVETAARIADGIALTNFANAKQASNANTLAWSLHATNDYGSQASLTTVSNAQVTTAANLLTVSNSQNATASALNVATNYAYNNFRYAPSNNVTFATNGGVTYISASSSDGPFPGATNYMLQAQTNSFNIQQGTNYSLITNGSKPVVSGRMEVTVNDVGNGTYDNFTFWYSLDTRTPSASYAHFPDSGHPFNILLTVTNGAGRIDLINGYGADLTNVTVKIYGDAAGTLLIQPNPVSLGTDTTMDLSSATGFVTSGDITAGGTVTAPDFNGTLTGPDAANVIVSAKGSTANLNLNADANVNINATNGAIYLISGNGNVYVAGGVTATAFAGNGFGLTNAAGGGTVIEKSAPTLLDFGSTTAGGFWSLDITVSGVDTNGGWNVVANPSNFAGISNATWCATVTDADTITVRFFNHNITGSSDPPETLWRITATKHNP